MMMMEEEKNSLRTVATNQPVDIYIHKQIKNKQASINNAQKLTRIMTANLLRIARGAGEPTRIYHDAKAVVLAFEEVAIADSNRAFPGDAVADDLRQLVEDLFGHRPNRFAFRKILRGALQLTASSLVNQATQMQAGMTELQSGISELEQ